MSDKQTVAIAERIAEILQQAQNDRAEEYTVAIKRVSDDSLIGYHLSTLCQITEEMLWGKRYDAAGDVAGQLKIIQKNYDHLVTMTDFSGLFGEHFQKMQQEHFEGIGLGEFYLEPVFLAEGTDKQKMTAKVIV